MRFIEFDKTTKPSWFGLPIIINDNFVTLIIIVLMLIHIVLNLKKKYKFNKIFLNI